MHSRYSKLFSSSFNDSSNALKENGVEFRGVLPYVQGFKRAEDVEEMLDNVDSWLSVDSNGFSFLDACSGPDVT